MTFFHVDQRPARARCEDILVSVTPAEADHEADADHEARRDKVYGELVQILRELRLASGTTPQNIGELLLRARDTGSPEVWRRVLDRSIPLRGRLRRVRAYAALAAVVGITAWLGWISPWLPVLIVLVVAWLALRAGRRYVARHADAITIHHMEEAAEAAEQTGDVDAVNALYAEARRMISQDLVPARVGFRVANILGAAAIATPFPVDVLRELRDLWLVAPETELTYAQVRDHLVRRLENRVALLAGKIRRALRAGETATSLRAELRELARTAPGIVGARLRQAKILRMLSRAATDPASAVPVAEILDEIEEVIARLEAHAGRVWLRDASPRELAEMLDEMLDGSTTLEARERAGALRERIEVLERDVSLRRRARRRASRQ